MKQTMAGAEATVKDLDRLQGRGKRRQKQQQRATAETSRTIAEASMGKKLLDGVASEQDDSEQGNNDDYSETSTEIVLTPIFPP